MFKIVHGYETITWEKPLKWRAQNLRHQNSLNYNQEITKTEARHNFFTNRIANEWNKLPEDVILAKSLNSFKAKLDKCTYKKLRKEELQSNLFITNRV
jgi:hypothetical protein